jgi:hypothetical protein
MCFVSSSEPVFSRTYRMLAFQARATMGPFALARTIMRECVLERPVQFMACIRELARTPPLRVASLCRGAASWERSRIPRDRGPREAHAGRHQRRSAGASPGRLRRRRDAMCRRQRPASARGEVWSVGEYAGRTGARLWEESYGPADAIFSALPEELRRNHTKPEAPPDAHLSNVDCSLDTFEGVRSEGPRPVAMKGIFVRR